MMNQELSQISLAEMLALFTLLGFFVGAIYDIIRIRRKAAGKIKKGLRKRLEYVMIFAEDIFIFFISGIAAAVIFYMANYGRVRWIGFLAMLAGFLAWHCTFGRLVMLVSDAVIAFFRRLFAGVKNRILSPAFKHLTGVAVSACRKINGIRRGRRRRKRTDAEMKKMLSLAGRGFGIFN